jgi:hypothetical protein
MKRKRLLSVVKSFSLNPNTLSAMKEQTRRAREVKAQARRKLFAEFLLSSPAKAKSDNKTKTERKKKRAGRAFITG